MLPDQPVGGTAQPCHTLRSLGDPQRGILGALGFGASWSIWVKRWWPERSPELSLPAGVFSPLRGEEGTGS